MNMGIKMFDDEVQIIEFSNSELLIENKKPVKIYLEGFSISEFVELMKVVKDHGGEVSSRVEAGVIILSHPNCSVETKSLKFHVNWLYDCIRSNRILNPSEYQLELPNTDIKHTVEVENHPPIGPINVSSQGNNAVDHTLREATMKISKGFPSPQKHPLPNITNENLVSEDTPEIRRTPKRKRCSQQPAHMSCDLLGEDKSSQSKRHLHITSSLLNSPIIPSSRSDLATSNIGYEVDCNSVKEDMIRKSEVFLFPQIPAATGINKNTVPEDASEIRKTPERRCSQQPLHRRYDSPEQKKSSKSKFSFYTEEENRAMIQYLIYNDAIKIAGGGKIWRKMHKDGMMQHRTVCSMMTHFSKCLRYRIPDYTSDEEALREFELRDSKGKRRAKKYRRSDSI